MPSLDRSTVGAADVTLDAASPGEAYEAVKARLAAIPAGEVRRVTADPRVAVRIVKGAMPAVRAVRSADGLPLPGLDDAHLAMVGTLADALVFAHVRWLSAASPGEPLEPRVRVLTETRATLLADATALSRHGIVDATRLGSLKGPSGYSNLVYDVLQLVDVLRDELDAVLAKSAIERGELDRAEQQARELDALVARRDQARPEPADAADARSRAFTALADAYDEVRRAVSYVRWHEGDADVLAPSMYGGRRRRPQVGAGGAAPTLPTRAAPTLPTRAAPATADGGT